MTMLELPVLVCGERKEPTEKNRMVLNYETGLEVRIPSLDSTDIERMRQSTNEDLRKLSIDDISIFMNELGKLWLDESFVFRKLAIQHARSTVQYVGPSIYYDLGLISTALRRAKIYDMLESEIGDPYLLDEWRPLKTVLLHAEPRGKIVHILVGNIPMAGLFSIFRSVITKNVTIAKLPRRDILTSLFFALSFAELDPKHPITRSLSVAYWEPGSPEEDAILPMADVVCAWGHRESLEPLKRKIPYGTDFVEFGPKRSIQLIGRDTPDYDYAAMKAAYDLSIYDQEACFSPQEAFVEGDVGPFVGALQDWLDKNLVRMPKGPLDEDAKARITRARSEAKFRGWQVYAPTHTGWTIIVTDGPCVVQGHPLSRTVYIHPVDDLIQAVRYVNKDTQTVAVHPPERASALADALVEQGVSRITEVGRMGRPRPGFAHDGMFPLGRLIRWVTQERGIRFKYKFWGLSPEEDDRLFYGRGEAVENADPMLVWKAYEEVNLR
jgi:long-chain-fatty-acyl-CoA reductase